LPPRHNGTHELKERRPADAAKLILEIDLKEALV